MQVLYSADDFITDPILAAVGELQFEVVQHRMLNEYKVRCTTAASTIAAFVPRQCRGPGS